MIERKTWVQLFKNTYIKFWRLTYVDIFKNKLDDMYINFNVEAKLAILLVTAYQYFEGMAFFCRVNNFDVYETFIE